MRKQALRRRAAASPCARLGHDFPDPGVPEDAVPLIVKRLCFRCGEWIAMAPAPHPRSRCALVPAAPAWAPLVVSQQPRGVQVERGRAPTPWVPVAIDGAPLADLAARGRCGDVDADILALEQLTEAARRGDAHAATAAYREWERERFAEQPETADTDTGEHTP